MIFYKLLLNLIKAAVSASLPQTLEKKKKKAFSLKDFGVLTDSFPLNSTTETTCIYSSLGGSF